MSVKQNCSAHIINITAQQIAARLAAHATIQEFCHILCRFLYARRGIQREYQPKELLNEIMKTSQVVAEAYDLLEKSGGPAQNDQPNVSFSLVSKDTDWMMHLQ